MVRQMFTYEIQFHGRKKVQQVHLEGDGLLLAFRQFGRDQKDHAVWVGELPGGVKIALSLAQVQVMLVRPYQQPSDPPRPPDADRGPGREETREVPR
jgi:hypothetical protein